MVYYWLCYVLSLKGLDSELGDEFIDFLMILCFYWVLTCLVLVLPKIIEVLFK